MENQDYNEGFKSGLVNVEAEHFQEYLQSDVEQRWITDRITENQDRLKQIDSDIKTFKTEQKPVNQQLLTKTAAVNSLEKELEGVEENISKTEAEKEKSESEKENRKTPYAMLAGVLYLLAGIAFVAGDLIISHEIVAYALNIRNTFEAWAFAVGLASLSILLKPAYERLVEQPYLNGQGKKAYGAFQVVLLTVSVGTLVVLGWFRYEAYKTDKLKEGINRQIKSLQLESTPIDPAMAVNQEELLQKIDQKLLEYDQLNIDLVSSPWAMLSFILSGVLFAIAGAICLGIAFPILQTYWVRGFSLNPKIRRAKRRLKKLYPQKLELQKNIQKFMAEQSHFQNQLNLIGSMEDFKAEKEELKAENKELLEMLRKAQTGVRVSDYKNGYSTGERSRKEMTDEEYEVYRKENLKDYEPATSSQSNPKVYKKAGLRPHQALRKIISDNFGEN
ncbi:hypothetical protein [Jiulongibacter sediminis]|uniref:DUF4407 domain-containing protein n=1 Tax=Jiulongibacter sediminis TaxID=1605367 RepID=A0A0P7BJ10_9BACT|nr:hypothetical protein [Jiulongibacter sediminis]KPM47136.1 hypothetical protein AFM12_15055 [Jiulongibacter sediminis]TBX22697.1 hypothetical protein TK44_15065 [Jiulongibacter sediminis]